jgi:general secretion pathway protein C
MALNRIVLWGVNAALAVLCCWIAAGLLADVAAELLAPAPTLIAASAPTPAPAPRTWQSRQAILDRNLFKASTATPPSGEAIAEELAATKLPLKLLGTVAAGDERRSWAAVEDLEKRQHLVVRVQDRLQGKAEVVRIERRRIVLRNGGRLEELALDEGQTPQAGAARTAATGNARSYGRADRRAAMAPTGSAAERVQRLAENRFGVQREDVDSVANNPAALFSQARILPKYDEGKMVGVQLNAIKAGSLFEQIGIRDGDTITELNGVQITSQQDSAAVLRELTSATSFNVTVTGSDGSTRQLTYEVQ